VTQTRYTFCRLCEATCGLRVEIADNQILGITPDPDHVVSRGYACVKGTRYASIQHNPDRVTRPLKRVGDEWGEIPWGQAISEIADKVRHLIARYGPETVGHFAGSPGGANVLAPIFRGALFAALGSRRMYGTGTCDTMNKFRVNEEMYGSPMRLAYPDLDRCKFILALGANPAISGNTLYHLPNARQRFKELVERGGRAIFINPRRIETSRVGEHLFIRPDTDLFFLAAFCNQLIREGHVDRTRVDRFMDHFNELERIVADWTPERQAAATGIPADILRELVRSHAAADGAVLYMATGVNQGRSGTLCFWLLECINAISGNLDRIGGTLMGEGLFDMAKEVMNDEQIMLSTDRGDGLPTVAGQQPAGMLADDILCDDGERVTALIVEASNPLLACPNPDGRLEEAFKKLELLVSIDLFRNETGNLAHYVLPATTWMERPEFPYALQSFTACTPTPYMIYADALLEPPPGVRHEWWMYVRLADALGVRLFENRLGSAAVKLAARLDRTPLRRLVSLPHLLLDGMLKKGGLPSGKKMVRDHPHGILLPQNDGGNFLGTERVLTRNGEVDLAPSAFVRSFEDAAGRLYEEEIENRSRFKLIGKRELNRINTSSCNSESLVRDDTNHVYLCPEDASSLGVTNDDIVQVVSAFGRIEIPARVTDEMMPRTIAIPQCWGHSKADGLRHAQKHPGVNANLLAGDGPENTERLSGMSHLSGILVDVRKPGAAPGP
jgi:anaerobic selenocysteine-containing dehydrogenase